MSRCSHVLIKVDHLPTAVADYRALGFQVHYATAEDKAMHAHVWFPGGPVLELLTTPRNAGLFRLPLDLAFGRGAGRRMVRWGRQAEGFCDAAVLLEKAELYPMRTQVPTGRVVNWTRRKPDGTKARFSFSYPRADRLPFLVTPYDPPQHPAEVVHANGATAISRVVLGVHPADRVVLSRFLGEGGDFALCEAERTGVLAVEFAGLTAELDPVRAHGAVLRPHS